MNTTQRLMTIAVGALFASCMSVAHAGYVNLNNVSGNLWEIQFSPITLTMKSVPNAGRLDWLVFEDFFAANSTANGEESGVQSISISVNGGAAVSYSVNNPIGTLNFSFGGIDPNDLFINIAGDNASASALDTVVVTQNGTGVQFISTDVPTLNTSWNGQVAFWNNNSAPNNLAMTTENSFILPEPATTALLALGLLSAGYARKRRAH